jgi:hypothetical protein
VLWKAQGSSKGPLSDLVDDYLKMKYDLTYDLPIAISQSFWAN